jgi:hypothetical protein
MKEGERDIRSYWYSVKDIPVIPEEPLAAME